MPDMKDFSFPFRLDSYGRVVEREGVDLISELVEMIILTSQGERVYRPTYGSNMLSFVFSPLERSVAFKTTEFRSEIENAIRRSEAIDGSTRMRVTRLEVSQDTSNNTHRIFLEVEDFRGERSQVSMEFGQ